MSAEGNEVATLSQLKMLAEAIEAMGSATPYTADGTGSYSNDRIGSNETRTVTRNLSPDMVVPEDGVYIVTAYGRVYWPGTMSHVEEMSLRVVVNGAAYVVAEDLSNGSSASGSLVRILTLPQGSRVQMQTYYKNGPRGYSYVASELSVSIAKI